MSNLIRCRKCKLDFVREEYDDHVCATGKFKGVRDIEVLQWWETKGDNGERVAFGLGSDGYNYRMIEPKEGFIEIDTHQPRVNTDNSQPNSYQNLKL